MKHLRAHLIVGMAVAILIACYADARLHHWRVIKLDAAIETARAEQIVNSVREETFWPNRFNPIQEEK